MSAERYGDGEDPASCNKQYTRELADFLSGRAPAVEPGAVHNLLPSSCKRELPTNHADLLAYLHNFANKLKEKDEKAWVLLIDLFLGHPDYNECLEMVRPFCPWPDQVFARESHGSGRGRVTVEDLLPYIVSTDPRLLTSLIRGDREKTVGIIRIEIKMVHVRA